MKKFVSFFLLAATIVGCGPFWVNPYITVKESQLNWVEIHYYNQRRKPIQRINVYLSGSGHVEVKKGTSELVSNDFAKRYKEDSWKDIKIRRYTVDTKHLHDIFQNLVNYGLLDREKFGKESKTEVKDRFIAVKANISNYTYSEQLNIFEADPDLAEHLLDVVRQFDVPGM